MFRVRPWQRAPEQVLCGMWSPTASVMRILIPLVAACLLLPLESKAQTPVAVPNPMAPHTMFIILIVAAFLAWAASFSANTLRGRSNKNDPKTLGALREAILDKLAGIADQRQAGTLSKQRSDKQTRQLRGKLAAVLTQLGRGDGKARKSR